MADCVRPSCSGQMVKTERGMECNKCGAWSIIAPGTAAARAPAAAPASNKIHRILISYDAWKQRTSLGATSRRSGGMKNIDKCLKAYLGNRNPTNFQGLLRAFELWKESKGPNDAWRNSSRNKKGAITELNEFIRQEQADMSRLANSKKATTEKSEMDHQRLGIIYLLGKTQVENNPSAIIGQMFSSALSVANKTGITQNAHAHIKPLSGGFVPGNSALANKAQTGDVKFGKNMANARDPKVDGSFWKDPYARQTSTSNPLHNQVDAMRDLAAKKGVNKAAGTFNNSSAAVLSKPEPKVQGWLAKIKQMLWNIWEGMKPYLGQAAMAAAKAALAKGIDLVIKELTKVVIPLGGAVIKTLENLYQAGKAMYDKWKAKGLLKRAHIKPGHAKLMIDTVYHEMTRDIWKGLKNVALSAFDGAVQIMTAGAGFIVSLIKAVVLALVDIAQVVHSAYVTHGILTEAGDYWNQHQKAQQSGGGQELIHRNPQQFQAWFSKVCERSTPLAVYCLNSGICTNLFTMFDDSQSKDGSLQRDFDNTEKAASYIKTKGAKYLKESKLKISSSDTMVNQTIQRVMNGGMLSTMK